MAQEKPWKSYRSLSSRLSFLSLPILLLVAWMTYNFMGLVYKEVDEFISTGLTGNEKALGYAMLALACLGSYLVCISFLDDENDGLNTMMMVCLWVSVPVAGCYLILFALSMGYASSPYDWLVVATMPIAIIPPLVASLVR